MNKILTEIDFGDLEADVANHLQGLVHKSVEAVLSTTPLMFSNEAELSVLLADDERLRMLNSQWRNIDKSTNVLSFPGSDVKPGEDAGSVLGDIAISLETVRREAGLENKSMDDHFCHLVIHGFLHLFGYDHETNEEALIMETREKVALEILGIADPYESESYS